MSSAPSDHARRGGSRSPSPLAWPFIAAIRLYQWSLAPLMAGHCRFFPTCSEYALEAYRTHGASRASVLTLGRLCRCHPLCRGGFDPVPEPLIGSTNVAMPERSKTL